MGITVAVKVEHLPIACALATAPAEKSRTLLVPNLDYHGTVRDTLNAFISRNIFLPEECQLLSAPLFTQLSEKDNVVDIYKRYSCQGDQEVSEVYLDEDTFTMYGREGGRFVDLVGEKRVQEYHILDKSTLKLKRLPRPLSEDGSRIFVETKDGVIPVLGVSPLTSISGMKHLLEGLSGIPVSQQLLSSVGRVMHDDFLVRDFDGLHKIYEDSIIDLCKSEDKNSEQAHRRMVVHVNFIGEEEFSISVQGRDSVMSVLRAVESRTGIAPWQQKISYSGEKTLGSYLIQPESILTVTMNKSRADPATKPSTVVEDKEGLVPKPDASKLKLMRTSKGQVKGTLTTPLIATDTVSDLKRKLHRTLAPLIERNLSVAPAQTHQPFGETMMRTPGKSPMKTPPSGSLKNANDGRKLNSESKTAGVRSLSFSKLRNLSPSPKTIHHSPQHCPVDPVYSPGEPKSGPPLPKKPVDDIPASTIAHPSVKKPVDDTPAITNAHPSVKKLTFTSSTKASPALKSTPDLNNSSCRDLMPELLSLPDLDPKDTPVKVIVERKPLSQTNENAAATATTTTTSRFGNVQSKIDTKLGAIKNIDKKAVKSWFSNNVESLKEHMRGLADG